jgi:hypothetical protein
MLWIPKHLSDAVSRCHTIIKNITEAHKMHGSGYGCNVICLSALLSLVDQLNKKIDGAAVAEITKANIAGLCADIIVMPVSSSSDSPLGTERPQTADEARDGREKKIVLTVLCLQTFVSLRRIVHGDVWAPFLIDAERQKPVMMRSQVATLPSPVLSHLVAVLEGGSDRELSMFGAHHTYELVTAFLGDDGVRRKGGSPPSTPSEHNLRLVQALLHHCRKRASGKGARVVAGAYESGAPPCGVDVHCEEALLTALRSALPSLATRTESNIAGTRLKLVEAFFWLFEELLKQKTSSSAAISAERRFVRDILWALEKLKLLSVHPNAMSGGDAQERKTGLVQWSNFMGAWKEVSGFSEATLSTCCAGLCLAVPPAASSSAAPEMPQVTWKGKLQRRCLEAALCSRAWAQSDATGSDPSTTGGIVLHDAAENLVLDDGRTLLHVAIASGRKDWVRHVCAVASVERLSAPARDGITPLSEACQGRNHSAINALLGAGCGPTIPDPFGVRPLEVYLDNFFSSAPESLEWGDFVVASGVVKRLILNGAPVHCGRRPAKIKPKQQSKDDGMLSGGDGGGNGDEEDRADSHDEGEYNCSNHPMKTSKATSREETRRLLSIQTSNYMDTDADAILASTNNRGLYVAMGAELLSTSSSSASTSMPSSKSLPPEGLNAFRQFDKAMEMESRERHSNDSA